jgi:nicotinate-nucleotide adenylyltransferase
MARLQQASSVFSLTCRKVIGILGGSFNPAHGGHAHIADMAVQKLGLDELWWLISPQNPLKSKSSMATFDQRTLSAMAIAETCHHTHVMRISLLEGRLGYPLTYQTLSMLRRRIKRARLVWIMGGDNLIEFHHWNRPEVISREMAIAVVNRPGSQFLRNSRGAKKAGQLLTPQVMRARHFPPKHWCYIQGKLNTTSATQIRSSANQNRHHDTV